jgi:hypothetical protein
MMRAVILTLALAVLATAPAAAQHNDEAIKRAVRTCVDLVHRLPIADALSARFYKEFDASATQRVMNNGWRNGDIATLPCWIFAPWQSASEPDSKAYATNHQ